MKPIVSKTFQNLSSQATSSKKLIDVKKSIGKAKIFKQPALDTTVPEHTSFPSRFIYSVDIPEVKDLSVKFTYNFFTPDEAVNDTDILSNDTVERMNLSQNIISKKRYEFTEEDLSLNRSKLPRFVRIEFTPPLPEKITYGTSQQSSIISENFGKIVKEENFSTSFFSALTFNNRELDTQTNIVFNTKDYTKTNESTINDPLLRQVMSQQDLANNTILKNGQGEIISNKYFEKIKKLSTSMQVNNTLLDDMVKTGAGNPLTPNFENFVTYSNVSPALKDKFNDYRITDSDYETSINYYKVISRTDSAENPSKSILLGYWIEKLELLPDGTKRRFDPIVIESSQATSYVDLNVRYGTTYVYEVRSIAEVSYAAVDNKTYDVAMISSLVASRGKTEYVETTENIEPPPPQDLMAFWNYDKINPLTMEFNTSTGEPYPATGRYGCLFLTWNFPINNSQMDIKKFQIFRRKSLEEPFELIKLIDFDDSVIKYPLLEENIDRSLISYAEDPQKSYYDFDFMKDSKYIYAVCAIDAHGLSSNYSSQIAVKFDAYSNKLVIDTISLAGAPKQYPNLYLSEDLFIDTMKTSGYKNMSLYFSPECYQVVNNEGQILDVLGTQQNGTAYVFNFINIENQNSARLDVNVVDNRSTIQTLKKVISQEEIGQISNAIKKAKENGFLKKKIKKYKKIKSFF